VVVRSVRHYSSGGGGSGNSSSRLSTVAYRTVVEGDRVDSRNWQLEEVV
jgi:hypothetical protein